jgi:hypothetical protein
MRDLFSLTGKLTVVRYEHTPKGLTLIKDLLHAKSDMLKSVFDEVMESIMLDDRYSLATQTSVNHNIITDEGDAMIADLMSETPSRTKVANATGYIPVGTNWTGTTPKINTWVNSQTGTAQALSATYPKLKGSWGAANDNVVQYRALYAAGAFGSVTITEAGISNQTTAAGDLLAYAQVNPSVVVTASDSLQIDWEITLLGA